MKTIFLITFFCYIYADSIQLAELREVSSNDTQRFSIGMSRFICQPYGVVTVEAMLQNKNMTPVCKQKIENYFLINPKQKYFAELSLHVRQNYHIEFKDSKCLVYAFGEKTLSEALIEKGVAIKKQNFNDDEFKFLFEKAQQKAKKSHQGIWSDIALQTCILGVYK